MRNIILSFLSMLLFACKSEEQKRTEVPINFVLKSMVPSRWEDENLLTEFEVYNRSSHDTIYIAWNDYVAADVKADTSINGAAFILSRKDMARFEKTDVGMVDKIPTVLFTDSASIMLQYYSTFLQKNNKQLKNGLIVLYPKDSTQLNLIIRLNLYDLIKTKEIIKSTPNIELPYFRFAANYFIANKEDTLVYNVILKYSNALPASYWK